uniref:SCAN box domain-containing protein n=1 Tax=Oryzias latipes TaxID=8090 RepID=A0A3P9KHB1_ORYLA
ISSNQSKNNAQNNTIKMDRGRADVYRAVNGVLWERRNISTGTCCQRLRPVKVPSGRRPAGARGRWKGLCRGWDRPERRTEEKIGGVSVMEQLQPVHPSDAMTWVEEHVPGGWTSGPLRCTREGRLQNCRVEIGMGHEPQSGSLANDVTASLPSFLQVECPDSGGRDEPTQLWTESLSASAIVVPWTVT